MQNNPQLPHSTCTNSDQTPQVTSSGCDSELIGSSDLLPPLLSDGGVKMCFFSLCFGLSGFSPSIITCPRDWVTVVQSAGNGSLFDICWSGGWKKRHRLSNLISRRSRILIPATSKLSVLYPTQPPSSVPAHVTLLRTYKDLILAWFFWLFNCFSGFNCFDLGLLAVYFS